MAEITREQYAGRNVPSWQISLNEYIRQSEPEGAARGEVWKAAIGLQAVDGLQVSDYLVETAREHIEGGLTIQQVQTRIDGYYEARATRSQVEQDGQREADVVSARIAAILGEDSFTFSPLELKSIHGRLFRGVVPRAGEYRDYDITKKEWVLDGRSVLYASCLSIGPTLDYDFGQERAFDYAGLNGRDFIRHFARFIAGIWQIHPFCEGNTRTTAVFAIKYLKSLGFTAGNDVFAGNSWYFRNALVRANYNDLQSGVCETTSYLELFFENALFGKGHQLKNRCLHIAYAGEGAQSAAGEQVRAQDDTLNDTINDTLKADSDERLVLELLAREPESTQEDIAAALGKSLSTAKRVTARLREMGLLRRVGSKKAGHWEVLGAWDESERQGGVAVSVSSHW